MVLIACWVLMTILIALVSCTPFEYNWNNEIDGHCGNIVAAFSAVAADDIIADLVILFLPMPRIWQLQLAHTTKLGLCAICGLGFVDVVMGILRVVYDLPIDFQANWTYTVAKLYFWSAMEPGLAIILASATAFRPLIQRIIPPRLSPSNVGPGSHRLKSYSNIAIDEGIDLWTLICPDDVTRSTIVTEQYVVQSRAHIGRDELSTPTNMSTQIKFLPLHHGNSVINVRSANYVIEGHLASLAGA